MADRSHVSVQARSRRGTQPVAQGVIPEHTAQRVAKALRRGEEPSLAVDDRAAMAADVGGDAGVPHAAASVSANPQPSASEALSTTQACRYSSRRRWRST